VACDGVVGFLNLMIPHSSLQSTWIAILVASVNSAISIKSGVRCSWVHSQWCAALRRLSVAGHPSSWACSALCRQLVGLWNRNAASGMLAYVTAAWASVLCRFLKLAFGGRLHS
jgi:hypothetical protein